MDLCEPKRKWRKDERGLGCEIQKTNNRVL